MKKLIKSILLLLLVFLISTASYSQDEIGQNEKMNSWIEYMTPGDMHEFLADAVGEWETISRWWMEPASEEPMESEGSAKFEMILGGRYQKSYHTGEVMGMPMEGMSIIGYDNSTEEFTSIWIDNMGTGTAVAKGKYDEESQSVIMKGSMIDPITKKDMQFKQVYTKMDDNRQRVEMYTDFNGREFKSMEVEMIRK